ncbi:MAG TPA: TIGR02757 family protein [Geothrix sp.]|nr:TIGR02757 family protein [Geothrix sp.]
MRNRTRLLKSKLDALCDRYDTSIGLALDPLTIPLAYANPLDRELVAFMAAHLAYGRVEPMLRAIQGVLTPMGPEPATWVRRHTVPELRGILEQSLSAWSWRFHTGSDMAAWVLAWKRLDLESGSGLEPHLLPTPRRNADQALSALVQRLRRECLPLSYGLRFSLPDPLEGAACKRWRMFLRWMVRAEWPDLGLWKRYPADQLVIPLDTHVARVSRFIGLSDRATPDGKMAREITESLRLLDPQDPLRYDFALSHLGILGDCPGVRHRSTCAACPLFTVCHAGVKSAVRIRH